MSNGSRWPLFHIVNDASKRVLLAARGPGDLPELPQVGTVPGWERPAEIDRLMRIRPVGPERRSA